MAKFMSRLDLYNEYASSGVRLNTSLLRLCHKLTIEISFKDSDTEQTPVVVRPTVSGKIQAADNRTKEKQTTSNDDRSKGGYVNTRNGRSDDRAGGYRQENERNRGSFSSRRNDRGNDGSEEKNYGNRQDNQRGYENRQNGSEEKDGYRQNKNRNPGGGNGNQEKNNSYRHNNANEDSEEKGGYRQNMNRNPGGGNVNRREEKNNSYRQDNENRRNDSAIEGNEEKDGYRQNMNSNRGGGSGAERGGYRNDGNTRGRQDDGIDERRDRDGKRNSGPPRNGSENGQEEPKDVVRVPLYIPPTPSTDEAEIFGQNISSGINFAKYDKIPIKVTGEKIPKPSNKFSEFGLNKILLENVRKSGYDQPTPIQKNAIPVLLEGRDLMGCAQTGSGKTAAYLLPLLHVLLENGKKCEIGYPQIVIISPTRELAIQISKEAQKFAVNTGLKVGLLYGGTSTRHQAKLCNQGCHVLVATVGRLLDFMEKEMVSYRDCQFVVLDEADRMLDMGFLPGVMTVMKQATTSKTERRQTLMFSATFPEDIQRLAGKFLNDYIFIAIGEVGGACADVEQVIVEVERYAKRDKLMEILANGDCSGTLIFVETKKTADFLAVYLSETEYPTTSIHGDRMQQQREEALADFKSNRMKVLIATSVAARGLGKNIKRFCRQLSLKIKFYFPLLTDIKNVKHVINYDLPQSIDEYVHRIGRTGRVGNKGKATSLFNSTVEQVRSFSSYNMCKPRNYFYSFNQDAKIAADLIRILTNADQLVPEFLKANAGNEMAARPNRDMRFGGRDVRTHRKPENTQPSAQEPEEHW